MRKPGLLSLPWAIALLAMAAIGGGLTWWNPTPLIKADRSMMDQYINSRTPGCSSTPLIAVLAQEPSFQELGAWPWPRSTHGELIVKLSQAKTVVVDLLFPESSSLLEDLALSDGVRDHGNCVLAIHLSDTGEGIKPIPPYEELYRSVKYVGVANVAPDLDGLYRFSYPLWNVGGRSLPSITLAGAMAHTGDTVGIEAGPLYSYLTLGDRKFPLTPDGGVVLSPFDLKDIPVYEYVDVLKGRVPEEMFSDSLVVVGINVAGLGVQDTLSMYRDGQIRSVPGALFVALSIHNLLQDRAIAVLPASIGGLWASLTSLAGGLLGLIAFSWSWMAALAVMAVVLVLPYFALEVLYMWIPTTGALWGLFLAYVTVASIRAISMSRSVKMGSIYTDVLSAITSDSWNGGAERSPEGILDRVWPEIEKLTSIRLLEKNLSEEDAQELSHKGAVVALDDSSSLLKIPGGDPPYRLLVKPAQGWEGLVVLGWFKNVSKEDLRSAMAMILSVSWFSVALKREQERLLAVEGAIKAVVAAVDAKDPETRGHSERVASLSRDLAVELGCSSDFVEELALGATLHDVGKIGIPDAILQKPAKLTDEEFARIKEHPSLGRDILRTVKLSSTARQALLEHHEKLDGSGYPEGLSGDQVSLAGRIVAVADAFDALSSRRTYKEGWPLEKILELFDQGSGILYDPKVVKALHSVGPDWHRQNHQTGDRTS